MTQPRLERGKQDLMQLRRIGLLRRSIKADVLNFLSAMAAGSAGVRWSLTGRCGTTHPPE